jgi:hypothetical protein
MFSASCDFFLHPAARFRAEGLRSNLSINTLIRFIHSVIVASDFSLLQPVAQAHSLLVRFLRRLICPVPWVHRLRDVRVRVEKTSQLSTTAVNHLTKTPFS